MNNKGNKMMPLTKKNYLLLPLYFFVTTYFHDKLHRLYHAPSSYQSRPLLLEFEMWWIRLLSHQGCWLIPLFHWRSKWSKILKNIYTTQFQLVGYCKMAVRFNFQTNVSLPNNIAIVDVHIKWFTSKLLNFFSENFGFGWQNNILHFTLLFSIWDSRPFRSSRSKGKLLKFVEVHAAQSQTCCGKQAQICWGSNLLRCTMHNLKLVVVNKLKCVEVHNLKFGEVPKLSKESKTGANHT